MALKFPLDTVENNLEEFEKCWRERRVILSGLLGLRALLLQRREDLLLLLPSLHLPLVRVRVVLRMVQAVMRGSSRWRALLVEGVFCLEVRRLFFLFLFLCFFARGCVGGVSGRAVGLKLLVVLAE